MKAQVCIRSLIACWPSLSGLMSSQQRYISLTDVPTIAFAAVFSTCARRHAKSSLALSEGLCVLDKRKNPSNKRKQYFSSSKLFILHLHPQQWSIEPPAGPTRVGATLRLLDLLSSFSLSLAAPVSRLPRTEPLTELVAEW